MKNLPFGIIAGLSILCFPWVSYTGGYRLEACIDYHCDRTRWVTLSDKQWHQVRKLFAPAKNAAEERQSIRRAIALLEELVGQLTGTWRDLGKNFSGAGKPGQLDCISESINTTTYLQVLQQDQLLRWHRVHERTFRNPWILDYHWTAVIEDLTDGVRYAVDSWYLDNGQQPYIQQLDDWRAKRKFKPGQ